MISHLEVYAPSSTTVSYVVSSRRSSTPKALTFLKHSLRAVVVWHALLLILVKISETGVSANYNDSIKVLLGATVFQPPLLSLAKLCQTWVAGLCSIIVIGLCLKRDYTEESLLVLQGMGIQTSTSSAYYFLSSTTTFIPTTQIQDIVIHEAFKGLEVRFYLAVIVEEATEVVVVFPTLLPRLEILQEVWRGARKCLYASGAKVG